MAVAAKYKKFDGVFRLYSGMFGVEFPLDYMRALSYGESRQDPTNVTGGAWGLFQVTRHQVADYNAYLKTQGTTTELTKADALDPTYNTVMWVWDATRIVRRYASLSVPNLAPDWDNIEFVKLLTMGWNGGWGNVGGVSKIAMCLKEKGIEVTHDNVWRYARECGGAPSLQSKAKHDFQKAVAELYFRLAGKPIPAGAVDIAVSVPKKGKGAGWLILLLAWMYYSER